MLWRREENGKGQSTFSPAALLVRVCVASIYYIEMIVNVVTVTSFDRSLIDKYLAEGVLEVKDCPWTVWRNH